MYPSQVVERQQQRQQLRQQRLQLDACQQHAAARSIAARVLSAAWFHRARRLAFYLPANGEIDTRLLIQQALRQGKQICLPVVSPFSAHHMYFVQVTAAEPLLANRWGIHQPQPKRSRIVHPATLDLVFMPLVGFDACGNRLGMGKGFYDRAFAFRAGRGAGLQRQRPQLAGLAHDFQQLALIPGQPWDIPLDRVVTPTAIINTSRCSSLR